ncbi:hypothetical protein PENTCL1PPCAC_2243 [Pristionchus entomophagus]|uniref:Activin types I and II receptor domain-containing protein n=1 Tax=Pristionchus entomophagus TaxID=358040 RepID=A0AAV5SHA5_9BILA|nr:hypothetical protein PENTCL1PPCAC_2243 [Pristionchus entomophagus]
MHKWTLFALPLYILITIPESSSLHCFDGINCAGMRDCDVCEGTVCLRMTRPDRKNGGRVTSLTCLPPLPMSSYYPEGCKTNAMLQEEMCVCSQRDLCNSSIYSRSLLSFTSLLAYLTLLHD